MNTAIKINLPVLEQTQVYAVPDLTKIMNLRGIGGKWQVSGSSSCYIVLDPSSADVPAISELCSNAGMTPAVRCHMFDGSYINTVFVDSSYVLPAGFVWGRNSAFLYTVCRGATEVKRAIQLIGKDLVSFSKIMPSASNPDVVPAELVTFDPTTPATRFKTLVIGRVPGILTHHIKGEANLEARGVEVWGFDKDYASYVDHFVPGADDPRRLEYDWPVVQDLADPGDLKDNRPCFDIVSLEVPESNSWDSMDYALSAVRSGGIVIMMGTKKNMNFNAWNLSSSLEQIVNLNPDGDEYVIMGVKRAKKDRSKNIERQLIDGWVDGNYKIDLKDGRPMVQRLSLISPWRIYPPTEITATMTVKQADYSALMENPTWCLMSTDKTERIPKEEVAALGIKKMKSYAYSYELTPVGDEEKEALQKAVKDNGWDLKIVPVEVKMSPGTDARNNPIPVEQSVLKEAGFTDMRRGWDLEVNLSALPETLNDLKALADREGWEMLVRGEKSHNQIALDTRQMPTWIPGPGKPLLLTGSVNPEFMSCFINMDPLPEVEAHGAESDIVFPVSPSPANVMKLFDHLTPRVMVNKAGQAELVFGCSVPVTETVQTVTDAGWPCTKAVTRPIAKLIRFVLEGDDTGLIIESNVG